MNLLRFVPLLRQSRAEAFVALAVIFDLGWKSRDAWPVPDHRLDLAFLDLSAAPATFLSRPNSVVCNRLHAKPAFQ